MIFEFEKDFAGTFRCIPMIVRFNLDLCGIKLSLKQWSRLGRHMRAELVTRPCSTTEEIESYRDELISAIRTKVGEEPKLFQVEVNPEWRNRAAVPARINEFAASRNVSPIGPSYWAALTDLQRFAIYKLTRVSHDNDNFVPALEEFGF